MMKIDPHINHKRSHMGRLAGNGSMPAQEGIVMGLQRRRIPARKRRPVIAGDLLCRERR
jgi:hypothetical protein